jgi:hypothetical protein
MPIFLEESSKFFDLNDLFQEGGYLDLDGVDVVFATVKSSSPSRGIAVSYWARRRDLKPSLLVLDWESTQLDHDDDDLLGTWLVKVDQRLQDFSKDLRARDGSIGIYIDDSTYGAPLLHAGRQKELPITPVGFPFTLTSVSGHIDPGEVGVSLFASFKMKDLVATFGHGIVLALAVGRPLVDESATEAAEAA